MAWPKVTYDVILLYKNSIEKEPQRQPTFETPPASQGLSLNTTFPFLASSVLDSILGVPRHELSTSNKLRVTWL